MTEEQGKIAVPPKGTRGDRFMGGIMMRLARPFFARQAARYQQATGPEPARFQGFPVLLLTTVGAIKSAPTRWAASRKVTKPG